MCQGAFIYYNKCIILAADVDSDGVCVCACACAGGVSRGYRRTHFTLSQSFCELKTSFINSVKSEKYYQAIWMIDLVLLSSLGVMGEHKIIQLRGGIAELELRACDFWETPLSTHTHTICALQINRYPLLSIRRPTFPVELFKISWTVIEY